MLFDDPHRHHPILRIVVVAGKDHDDQPDVRLYPKPTVRGSCAAMRSFDTLQ
jgi:hypothetical protein